MALSEFPVTPDFEAFRRVITRQGTSQRVHFIELYLDGPVKQGVTGRFGVGADLNRGDPFYELRREIALHQFLGYDLMRLHASESEFRTPPGWVSAGGQALATSKTIQGYTVQEHAGPIQVWEDLERFPWPRASRIDPRPFEWMEKNLPEGMKTHDLVMQVFEATTWLMGYESLFMNLLEEPDLVDALIERIGQSAYEYAEFLCQFDCVGALWGTDDMGFRSMTMVPPEWLRERILPWHRKAAALAHQHGKLYFLHSCGNVDVLMNDLIEDVKIDAKHSFEDAITPVIEFYDRYNLRIGVLGGLDVDFLCRADESTIRRRVRETLDHCMPGGGYALGSGNSITSYIPLENYFAMLDEGRRWGR